MLKDNRERAREIASFWTPERIKAARPREKRHQNPPRGPPLTLGNPVPGGTERPPRPGNPPNRRELQTLYYNYIAPANRAQEQNPVNFRWSVSGVRLEALRLWIYTGNYYQINLSPRDNDAIVDFGSLTGDFQWGIEVRTRRGWRFLEWSDFTVVTSGGTMAPPTTTTQSTTTTSSPTATTDATQTSPTTTTAAVTTSTTTQASTTTTTTTQGTTTTTTEATTMATEEFTCTNEE